MPEVYLNGAAHAAEIPPFVLNGTGHKDRAGERKSVKAPSLAAVPKAKKATSGRVTVDLPKEDQTELPEEFELIRWHGSCNDNAETFKLSQAEFFDVQRFLKARRELNYSSPEVIVCEKYQASLLEKIRDLFDEDISVKGSVSAFLQALSTDHKSLTATLVDVQERFEKRGDQRWLVCDAYDYEKLSVARNMLDAHLGDYLTPAENFLYNLLWHVSHFKTNFTPDDVEASLIEFREHFNDCIETAKRVMRDHPELLAAV